MNINGRDRGIRQVVTASAVALKSVDCKYVMFITAPGNSGNTTIYEDDGVTEIATLDASVQLTLPTRTGNLNEFKVKGTLNDILHVVPLLT